MSRLEDKLIELGYGTFKDSIRNEIYATKVSKNYIYIHITIVDNKIVNVYVKPDEDYCVRSMKDINKLKTQYKKLQKDLEILKAIDKPSERSQKDIANELWEKDVKHMQELGEWERKQWNY